MIPNAILPSTPIQPTTNTALSPFSRSRVCYTGQRWASRKAGSTGYPYPPSLRQIAIVELAITLGQTSKSKINSVPFHSHLLEPREGSVSIFVEYYRQNLEARKEGKKTRLMPLSAEAKPRASQRERAGQQEEGYRDQRHRASCHETEPSPPPLAGSSIATTIRSVSLPNP